MAWTWLTAGGSNTYGLKPADFDILAKFLDAKQVAIPIAAALLLYLVVTLLAHQASNSRAEAKAHDFRELLHGELSSILMSSSSLALVVGLLSIWAGAGWATIAWWPVGLFFSYYLRPRSQDSEF